MDLGVPGVTGAALVGRGGFGAVYRAEQPALGRPVAVKLLTRSGDPQALRRFARECTAIGAVSGHPNIVAVYAAGATQEGVPYLVMQLLLRGSLADRLAEQGPLPWEEVASIGVKLAGALATAHRAGVLHRDLKPGNVLMSDYGEPMLADFGIARVAGALVTTAGAASPNTLAHAPPEAIAGRAWTERSDVWSLASTLHELLSGQPPFLHPDDESLVPLLARVAMEPPPDLRRQGVPGPLCAVLEAAMAKDPAQRVGSAVELGQLLRAAQSDLGQPPTPMPVAGQPGAPDRALGYRPPPQQARPPLAPDGGPPAPRGLVPALVEVRSSTVHVLAEGRHVIGRDASADIVLPAHRKIVSRRHCAVQVEGGSITVEDLGSHNGTYVNSVRIAGLTPLRPGDRLQIGATTFALEEVEARPGRAGDHPQPPFEQARNPGKGLGQLNQEADP